MERKKQNLSRKQRESDRVDEALEETFPASDPSAATPIIRQGPPVRNKKDKRE
ncbi:MAG TPA: hypothetical protein VGL10_05915 [Gammaproteobacteria bacterium]